MTYLKNILIIFAMITLTGCTMNGGFTGGNANYAFPNSNVTPIKQVRYSTSSTSFFTSEISSEDMQDVLDKALEQSSDADVLINYTLDTKVTMVFPFVYSITFDLRGTAASMEVGRQYIGAASVLKKLDQE